MQSSNLTVQSHFGPLVGQIMHLGYLIFLKTEGELKVQPCAQFRNFYERFFRNKTAHNFVQKGEKQIKNTDLKSAFYAASNGMQLVWIGHFDF